MKNRNGMVKRVAVVAVMVFLGVQSVAYAFLTPMGNAIRIEPTTVPMMGMRTQLGGTIPVMKEAAPLPLPSFQEIKKPEEKIQTREIRSKGKEENKGRANAVSIVPVNGGFSMKQTWTQGCEGQAGIGNQTQMSQGSMIYGIKAEAGNATLTVVAI